MLSFMIFTIVCVCNWQVIVLLCGTNNHNHTAEQVTEGILEIVKTMQEKQPQAQIIVVVSTTQKGDTVLTHGFTAFIASWCEFVLNTLLCFAGNSSTRPEAEQNQRKDRTDQQQFRRTVANIRKRTVFSHRPQSLHTIWWWGISEHLNFFFSAARSWVLRTSPRLSACRKIQMWKAGLEPKDEIFQAFSTWATLQK